MTRPRGTKIGEYIIARTGNPAPSTIDSHPVTKEPFLRPPLSFRSLRPANPTDGSLSESNPATFGSAASFSATWDIRWIKGMASNERNMKWWDVMEYDDYTWRSASR